MQYRQKTINPAIFRAYDIRGIVGAELDEHVFYTIGLALATRLQSLNRTKAFVAQDGRLTSPLLTEGLKQGLIDAGIDVIDLGKNATPVMYFATCTQEGIDSGFMVTGSHNPSDYNGIKMVLAGKTLMHRDIDQLHQLILRSDFAKGTGSCEHFDIVPDYTAEIIKTISLQKKLKVVVDCGNGIAGSMIPGVLEKIGCEVIPLFCEVDGRFPNHHPDPAVESNLDDLKKIVLEQGADIGLAFDGDADRLGVVTNEGKVIWPDRLMMMYCQDLLTKKRGATIVFDVKCSGHLATLISSKGGVAKMCATGHSIVKSVMKEEKALLAGEMSGHIFFKDRWYGFDDALYSACRLLEILSQDSASVHAQFATIPDSINTPEIKIPIADDKKFIFMEKMREQAVFPGSNLVTIDGLRVEFPEGWGLLRASNTTPCLVARFEAVDANQLKYIQGLFRKALLSVDSTMQVPF